MKRIKTFILRTLLPTLAITATVLASVCPISCRVTEESLSLLEGDFTVPRILSYSVVDENTVCISFSKQVEVPSATVTMESEQQSVPRKVSVEVDEETTEKIYFVLEEEMEVGQSYQLDGCVRDKTGNLLSFTLGFTGFNARVPKLILSEVRNAYGKSSVSGVSYRKTEFVELLMLSDGNLFGVQIESANDGDKTKYVFPSVEVKKGDFVTVHMRQIPQADLAAGESMADELGEDLTLSHTQDTCSKSRDLWSSNTASVFASSDIITVRPSAQGPLLDVLVFAQSDKDIETLYPEWYALATESGIWEGEAFNSTSVSSSAVTRSMSRKNVAQILTDFSSGQYLSTEGVIPNCASQWMVTADKTVNKIKYPGATPGYANSVYAYSK